MLIPGFFINLDESSSRREHMMSEGVRVGLALTRVAAVRGDRLSPEQLKRWQPRFDLHPMSPPEIGCFLSHRAVWAQIADGGSRFGAVFEDDVMFADQTGALLASDDWLPDDVSILKVETNRRSAMLSPPFRPAPDGRGLARMASEHLGAGGYILSRQAARRLLAASETITVPVDYALFSPTFALLKPFDAWQLDPAICIQQIRSAGKFLPEAAEISGLDASRKHLKLNAFAKMRRELARPLSQAALHACRRIEAVTLGHRWKAVPFRR